MSYNWLLSSTVKPLKPSISGDNQVDDEDSVTLTCNYPGSTLPSQTTFTWVKGFFDIFGESDQSLTITTAKFESAGDYVCVVTAFSVVSDRSDGHTLTGIDHFVHQTLKGTYAV